MGKVNAKKDLVRSLPWYREITAKQWKALLASNLGWMFDGYEILALILTLGPALRQLLAPSQVAQLPAFAGIALAITVLGWGAGGLLGGILADYFGRKRVMILAMIAYSVMTGLSAFAWDWTSFVALRFLVGLAIGSEWSTGASMTAEVWPDQARGRGAGLMQCGAGIGNLLASVAWLLIGSTGPNAWRWLYLLGVLPAFLTIWLRRGVDESKLWEAAAARRRAARDRQRSGAALDTKERHLTRFTLAHLFAEPEIRRQTILIFLISLSTTVGWWGITTWVPQFIAAAAAQANLSGAQWAAYTGFAYTAGSIIGFILFGFLADAIGRKLVTALYLVLALVLTPVLFLWARDLEVLLLLAFLNAMFSTGQYSWIPVWLPELYPTHVRATAMAFAFNGPRFVAFLGPLFAGQLIVYFGGFGYAATALSSIYVVGLVALLFLPETKGRSLPA